MTIQATEQRESGLGFVDSDGRPAYGLATGQGKVLQFASISTAASGATTLVAAQGAGLKIKVVSYAVVASGAVTVQFTGTGNLTGAMSLAANGGLVVAGQPSAHLFETAANALLAIVLGGAVQVSGHLAYFVE